jgi:hypothetical protein
VTVPTGAGDLLALLVLLSAVVLLLTGRIGLFVGLGFVLLGAAHLL